jgi:hypothetical protein
MTKMGIEINNDNYYSEQANIDYMSVSQFKDFAGTLMHTGCEETAYEKMMNLIPQPVTKALLVGSYIDAFYEGTLDAFKSENRDNICTKTSIKAFEKSQDPNDLQLLADFKQAESIIEKTTGDALFSEYMSGQKQVIMTANLFGVDWKIKMDSYHPDDKIVDLKVMRSMDPIWSDKCHMKSDFIRYWGYDIQGAVYQKVVELRTGKKLPFFIACATKEEATNIEVIQIDQQYLDDALAFVQQNIQHVLDLKNGVVKPVACGNCYWCRKNKKLTAPISMQTIVPVSSTNSDEEAEMSAIAEAMAENNDNAADTAITAGFGLAPSAAPFHLFGDN